MEILHKLHANRNSKCGCLFTPLVCTSSMDAAAAATANKLSIHSFAMQCDAGGVNGKRAQYIVRLILNPAQ